MGAGSAVSSTGSEQGGDRVLTVAAVLLAGGASSNPNDDKADCRLWVWPVAGGNPRTDLHGQVVPSLNVPSFTPDGRSIVFGGAVWASGRLT